MTAAQVRLLNGALPPGPLHSRAPDGRVRAHFIVTADFGKELSFSDGIPHVLVNGTFVVRDGKTVEDPFPGRSVLGKYRN